MALTIATEILGQEATSSLTYCYLYEPLRIKITESDLTARKIYVEVEIRSIDDTATVVDSFLDYGDYDINSGQALSVDLMKLAQQHHDANIYNFSHIDEIVSNGAKSVVSEYVYVFRITSDITTTPVIIQKLPIIGGRSFKDFTPNVDENYPITEAKGLGLDLRYQWDGFPSLETQLSALGSTDVSPIIEKYQTGLNRIVNSNFLNNSNWTLQSNDLLSNGEFFFGGASGSRTPNGYTPVFGRTYTVKFTITQIQSGQLDGIFDGDTGANVSGIINSVGAYSFTYVQTDTASNKLSFYSTSGFRGKMKDVSWIEHENLISDIDISSSYWNNGGDAVVTSSITSPTGDSDAYKLSSSSGTGYVATKGIDSIKDGDEFKASVWLKGTSDVKIRVQELFGGYTSHSVANISPTATWTRYEISGTKGVDGNDVRMVIEMNSGSTGEVDIYLPHIENLTKSERSACGGQLVWKSRLGGWMTWGFKLKKESQAKSYSGDIQVGMFESTLATGGNAFVPVNYTGINTSYSLTLKELALTTDELRAVQSIIASPAVYYMKDNTGKIELMRLTSASAPLDNKANGGDFSVSLKSISTSMQKTK